MACSPLLANSKPCPSHTGPSVRSPYGPATSSKSHAIASSPSDRHAGDVDPEAVHIGAGGHEKRLPVVLAEAHVGGQRQPDPAQLVAVLIDHMNATRSGAVDVALLVHLHAVRSAPLLSLGF